MKIPNSIFAAALLFLLTHIAEAIISFQIMSGGLGYVNLFFSLITVCVPILFLAGLKSMGESLKILAIITVVYGFLFIYLNFTEKNAFGKFTSWMWIFNLFEIFAGIFLYYTLSTKKISYWIENK